MRSYVAGIVVIVLAVVALHGRSIGYGLMLDDNNHRAELREGGWSFRDLVDASHLGDPRRRVQMWWQNQADQFFFRPLAFFLMKIEYVVGGWRPAAMHVFSLMWTAANGVLVMLLARSAGLGSLEGVESSPRLSCTTACSDRGKANSPADQEKTPEPNCRPLSFWAVFAGVLFVAHPANALTTQWIACQNEQMATAFLLAGILCWAHRTGWRRIDGTVPPPGGSASGIAALVLFIAALGCRETAVVFGPLVMLGDWFLRPAKLKGRMSAYALLVLLTVAYFAIRHRALGGFTLLGPPYAYLPSTPGFERFVFDKFLYYVMGLFAYVPIIGFAGMDELRAQPAAFYGAFAVVACTWAILLVWLRPMRTTWLWLAMATLPLLPVLPVFASSHHLYMASAGAMLAVVTAVHAMWERIDGLRMHPETRVGTASSRSAFRVSGSTPDGLAGKAGRVMLATAVGLYLAVGTALNFFNGLSIGGFSTLSQLPAIEAIEFGGPYKPNDRLFFINLPPLGFNCMPAIEEASGAAPLTGYVLTFSSDFMGMTQPSFVERVGERGLRVRAEGDGWFSALMGRSMLEAIGRKTPFATGEQFETPDFTVEIGRAGETGIGEMLFTFALPLDDPTYHFFFGSSRFTAYPLRFDPSRK